MTYRRITISGADGTGKTTIINALCCLLERDGLNHKKIWLRFNHFLGKLVNLFGRLYGKSYYENYEWGRVGYHNYTGSIGVLYIYAVFIDTLIVKIFRRNTLRDKKNLIVIDRFIVDTMADLIVDTKKTRLVLFLFTWIARAEGKKSKVYILRCDYDEVISRRPDIADDKVYKDKARAFRLLAKVLQIPTLRTDRLSIDECVSFIKVENHV